MTVHRTLFACLSALLASVILGGTATAAPGPWVTPGKSIAVQPTVDIYSSNVAVDSDGTVAAVWTVSHQNDEELQDDDTDSVMAAIRPRFGKFGRPFELSGDDHRVSNVQVVGGASGITVMWQKTVPGGDRLATRTRPPGGRFGPVGFFPAGDHGAYDSRIAMGDDGTTVAVWSRPGTAFSTVVQASIRPPGGDFGLPVDLSPEEANVNVHYPDVAITRDGTITVVWAREAVFSEQTIEAVSSPPGGSFGEPVPVSDPGWVTSPVIVAAPDGTTTVVWRNFATGLAGLFTSSRAPGGGFGPRMLVTGANLGGNGVRPGLAVSNDGLVTAVWGVQKSEQSQDPDHPFTYDYTGMGMATWKPGQHPEKEWLGRSEGLVASPDVTTSADGSTSVIWPEGEYQKPRGLLAMTRPEGGEFSEPVRIDQDQPTSLSIASSRDGNLVATWPGSIDDSYVIKAASTVPSYCRKATIALGSVTRNRKAGTARILIDAESRGLVRVKGTRQVKPASGSIGRTGERHLKIVPRGRIAGKLNRKGRAAVRVRISFDPRARGCLKDFARRTVTLQKRGR